MRQSKKKTTIDRNEIIDQIDDAFDAVIRLVDVLYEHQKRGENIGELRRIIEDYLTTQESSTRPSAAIIFAHLRSMMIACTETRSEILKAEDGCGRDDLPAANRMRVA